MLSLRAVRLIMSLGMALLFWLSVKLSATYHAVLEVPVSYVALPRALSLTSPPPAAVTVDVDSRGWLLMMRALRRGRDTLVLDLSTTVRSGTLSPEHLRVQVDDYFSSGVTVRSIQPDSIRLRIEAKVFRRLPVALRVGVTPAPGYLLTAAPAPTPDSVLVLAPQRMLDSLTAWPSKPLQLRQVAELRQVTVPLARRTGAFTEPTEVRVSVQAERYTEGVIDLPLTVVNAPRGATVRLDPATVRLRYQAPLSQFSSLQPFDFAAAIDMSTASEAGALVTPVVTRLPPEVRFVRLEPRLVRVVVSYRPTPAAPPKP